MTIYLVMTLQMVYLQNVTNKINLTESMINPETIEFMGINILLLFLSFFIQSKDKKNKKKKKIKKNSNENLKFYNRFFLFSFLFR